jgi:hypothetical protein
MKREGHYYYIHPILQSQSAKQLASSALLFWQWPLQSWDALLSNVRKPFVKPFFNDVCHTQLQKKLVRKENLSELFNYGVCPSGNPFGMYEQSHWLPPPRFEEKEKARCWFYLFAAGRIAQCPKSHSLWTPLSYISFNYPCPAPIGKNVSLYVCIVPRGNPAGDNCLGRDSPIFKNDS